jgi:hypothetical protein
MYWTPGPDSSNLIKTEKAVPNNPLNNANIRYNVPISFALLDRNQRSDHMVIFPCLIVTSSEYRSLDRDLISKFSSIKDWLGSVTDFPEIAGNAA